MVTTKKGSSGKGKQSAKPEKVHKVNKALTVTSDEDENENTTIDRTPRSLVTGGKFHNWDEQPDFEGVFTGETVLHEKDDPEMNVEKGDVRGYIFNGLTDEGDLDEEHEGVVIGASYSVEKAMNQVDKNAVLRFQYKGKSKGKGGKNFKNFNIDLIGYWDVASGKITS